MIRRFFAYYAPWRGLFMLDFGCALLSGLLELGFPMAVRGFVDHLLPTHNLESLEQLVALLSNAKSGRLPR